ncbi:MAG: OmpA family protein [Nevskiales bacterium]|nr:OmpA family protein [Nevskiales bacterium]
MGAARTRGWVRTSVIAGATCAAAAIGTAHAADDASTFQEVSRAIYVAPMLTLTIPDDSRENEKGIGGTLSIGTRLTDFLAIEATGYYNKLNDEADLVPNSPTEMVGYGGNLLLFPFSGGLSNVFGIVGAQKLDVTEHPAIDGASNPILVDYDSTVYEAGVGVLSAINLFGNPAAVRFEIRYRLDPHDQTDLGTGGEDQFSDGIINLGLMVPLFKGKEEAPPPPPPPPPVVVPVVEPPPPADTDGDGVTDDLDQCPETPAGTEVDEVGCPLPPPCESPADGQKGDLRGCKAGDVVVLHGVNFEFDKAALTANAKTLLDLTAEALAEAPAIKVEVGGHTDAKGADAYNQKLSERRAQAVVDYLAGKGIDPARMRATGYGESRPVADNETEEGREQNRRVELTVEE